MSSAERIGSRRAAVLRAATGNFDLSGSIVGCDIQLSNFIIGVEDDFSRTNKNGSVFQLVAFRDHHDQLDARAIGSKPCAAVRAGVNAKFNWGGPVVAR